MLKFLILRNTHTVREMLQKAKTIPKLTEMSYKGSIIFGEIPVVSVGSEIQCPVQICKSDFTFWRKS